MEGLVRGFRVEGYRPEGFVLLVERSLRFWPVGMGLRFGVQGLSSG